MARLLRSAAVLAAAGVLCGAALAQPRSDAAREKRWADQFVPSLVVGQAVELQAEGEKFLALHAPGTRAGVAVLLAHGPGLHPDHGITGELRVGLNDAGFTTLSLQMPVLPAEVDDGAAYRALYPAALRRIAAGMRFLQEKGARRVAIVSHAMGAGMAHAYLAANRAAPVFAWVALSYYGAYEDLAGPGFPILDLYGASDYRGIRGPAGERARILAQRPGSRQLAVPEGGRFLAGGERVVLRETAAFLDAAAR
jgi:hypothetical protein